MPGAELFFYEQLVSLLTFTASYVVNWFVNELQNVSWAIDFIAKPKETGLKQPLHSQRIRDYREVQGRS